MTMQKTIAVMLALLALSLSAYAEDGDDTESIGPGVDTSAALTADEPGVATSDAADTPRASATSRAVDSLTLDSSQIIGNQELPQVLYIVPWKASDLGDLVGRPVNTLLDEVLAPADREVFKRQIQYYDDLHSADADKDT